MPEQLRVLVADADASVRAAVRTALAAGMACVVCAEVADAVAAVDAVMRFAPDILLLDINLPGGGIAAIWEITARRPETRVVVLTASADESTFFGALRAGAGGYLLKDMDFARIPDALRDVAGGRAAVPRALVARLVEEFRDNGPRWRGRDDVVHLTSREWQVIELLRRGLTTRQIATRLLLSPVTVRTHIAGAVRKLGVQDRTAILRQS